MASRMLARAKGTDTGAGQRRVGNPSGPPNEEKLKQWLSRYGVQQQPLEVRQFREGRGLAATRGIKRNERLLGIPMDAVVTPEKAVDYLGKGAESLPEWSAMAAFLAAEAAKGDQSEWAAYIRSLPDTSGGALEWEEHEVGLLEGSPWLEEAKERRASVSRASAMIGEAVPDVKGLSDASLLWAFSMLFSRLIRLDSGKASETIALIPWADLINHDSQTGSYVQLDGANGCVLRPDRVYEEGQQVYASYGDRSSGELLVSYGFVPPEASPSETVPIALAINDSNDPLADAKRAALRRRGLAGEISFPLRMGALPEGALEFAGFAAAELSSPEEAEQLAREAFDGPFRSAKIGTSNGTGGANVGQLAKRALGAIGLGPRAFKSPERESEARRALADACRSLLEEYPTSFEDDKARAKESAQGKPAETPEDREACSAAVRFRERALLSRIEYVMRSEAAELRSKALSLPW